MAGNTNMGTILCVEDERDLLENITIVLESKGYAVIQAENGKEAYDVFKTVKPDLVLSDINMPVMTGTELLENLMKDYKAELNYIPFIFLTAFGQKKDKIAGIEFGADDYIVKPVDFDVLLSVIESKLKKAKTVKTEKKKSVEDIAEKISYLIPREVKGPLQNILSYAQNLKKEIGESPENQKIYDYATKIYLASMKLNSQITKFLDKDKILNNTSTPFSTISAEDLLRAIRNEISDSNIKFRCAKNLPSLTINTDIFVPALINYIKQHIISDTKEIVVEVFLDYAKNIAICVAGKTFLPVFLSEFEELIKNLNGSFSIQENNGITDHLITLPNHSSQEKNSELEIQN